MIKMDSYSLEFEEEYWNTVNKKIGEEIQKDILKSCKKFLPEDFFVPGISSFESVVRAPFAKLKRAKQYIDSVSAKIMKEECFDPSCKNKSGINDLYIEIYNAFESVAKAQKNKTFMRVRMVREAGFTVCPYCNRDYINCRADTVSGAQLDHFFSRSEYPVFAVSLYNLVPVCGNCNRVKSDRNTEFASPFDETIDWENDVRFTYHHGGLGQIKIRILSSNEAVRHNISAMRIEKAYQIHDLEILEIEDRRQAYSESQKQEIREVLKKIKITDDEIKRIIFGPKITPGEMKKKPLGKMISDIHKELEIY